MSTNAETVRKIQDAIGRGAFLEMMGHLARDVSWAINTDKRDTAPWFKEYKGRQGVLAFFEDISVVEMEDFELKDVFGDGDRVLALLHFTYRVPGGGRVDMDEAQIWSFEDGKVQSVELFPDTLAIANAYA